MSENDKTEKFGSFMIDGQIVDVDGMQVEELEKIEKRLSDLETQKRVELNDLLTDILK